MNAKRLGLATVVTASALLLPQELGAVALNGNHLYTDCTATTTKVPTEQFLLAGTCTGCITAITDARQGLAFFLRYKGTPVGRTPTG